MVISDKNKFLFLEYPKSATKSIRTSLMGLTGSRWYTGGSKRHGGIDQSMIHFPQAKEYFKFAFVRNPWCRTVSFYLFKKARSSNKIYKELSFKEYVNSSDHFKSTTTFFNFGLNSEISLDFIGRFENLEEDFYTACGKIGIKGIKIPLKQLNKRRFKYKSYTEYYDDDTREVIAEKYKKDIEYFGYKFGE